MFNANGYLPQRIPTEKPHEDVGNTFVCSIVCFFFFNSYKIFKGSFMSHRCLLETD